MRNIFPVLILCIFGSLTLVACSNAGAPNCSDDDIKQLVLDISKGEIKKQLFAQSLLENLGSVEQAKLVQMMLLVKMKTSTSEATETPTYEKWNALKDKNELIKKTIDVTDKKLSKLSLTLSGIRTNGQNDEIMKSQCGGSLTFPNGKQHSIEFSAQYTEDGQVYVEVSGL